jgi:hypothetical protein
MDKDEYESPRGEVATLAVVSELPLLKARCSKTHAVKLYILLLRGVSCP